MLKLNTRLRKAIYAEIPQIWVIIQGAIARRKADGSKQWQEGYPNESNIENDIEKSVGYVLINQEEKIIGYAAILINDEPAYEKIRGKWLTNDDFVVVHRLAIAEEELGKGLAKQLLLHTEKIALENKIHSVKCDTNFDNIAMLKIFEQLGYSYCGEVELKGGTRKAFEKYIT